MEKIENGIINMHVYRELKMSNKNVKIDNEVHREMSIESAKMGVGKTTLTNALIRAAMSLPDEVLIKFIKEEQEREKNYPTFGKE